MFWENVMKEKKNFFKRKSPKHKLLFNRYKIDVLNHYF